MKKLILSLALAAALFGFAGTARADHGGRGGHHGYYGHQAYYGHGYYGGYRGYYGGYRGYYPGYFGRPYVAPYGYYAPYGYAYPYSYVPGVSFGIYRPGVAVQFGVYP